MNAHLRQLPKNSGLPEGPRAAQTAGHATSLARGLDFDRASVLDRCLAGEPFVRVDPQCYVRLALHSLGVSAVRRSIGDPHLGPQLRRLATELGSRDVAVDTREYARRLPDSHLGPSRAADALLTSARVRWAASVLSFDDLARLPSQSMTWRSHDPSNH